MSAIRCIFVVSALSGSVDALTTTAAPLVYLGRGCFWERQYATYLVELKAFSRNATDFSSRTGYAGGTPSSGSSEVCYNTGDERDYTTHGFAEVVQTTLDAGRASAQMHALARDFFDSFVGPVGQRLRPDQAGDRGTPYRSLLGVPGGILSPLYTAFASQNSFNMTLKPGSGSDPDEINTVWIYDSKHFPFFAAEVYHQAHCDFEMSKGMPYSKTYIANLWNKLQVDGGVYGNLWKPTGCPEMHEGVGHPGYLCDF